MSPLLIGILAFVGVAALVGGAALLLARQAVAEDRGPAGHADGHRGAAAAKDEPVKDASVLARPLDDAPAAGSSGSLERFGNFDLLFEQADTTLTSASWPLISAVLAVLGRPWRWS